ncbi:phosphoglycerate kinase, partial [bacterium]|nr:phosphoglycerate kinase [bacterium]
MKPLKDLEPKDKKILVRLDFDVPCEDSKIEDPYRLESALRTLRYLLSAQKLYLIGHLDRPEGEVKEGLRLRPQAKFLAEKLGLQFSEKECPEFSRRYLLGDKIEVLENLRFFPGEEANEKEFAQRYASLAEVFVFEAFAVSHRKHASVYWLPRLLPSYLGFRAQKEMEVLDKLRQESNETIAVVGGAKAEDKAEIIKKFPAKRILLGGKTASELYLSGEVPPNALLPEDGVLEDGRVLLYKEMSKEEVEKVRDIGPRTIALYRRIIREEGKNILFAGPVGQFEKEEFSKGTRSLYEEALNSGKFAVLLGGD